MYWFIGEGVKNSVDIMVEATAVNTLGFPCLKSCHSTTVAALQAGEPKGVDPRVLQSTPLGSPA